MPHIYLSFAYPNEEKAQEARHKLEVWKQASRLDKKLLYKFERAADQEGGHEDVAGKTKKDGKKGKEEAAGGDKKEPVKLLVRLGFSAHEKLSEQRFLERIRAEELFQGASPATIKPGEALFSETETRFEELA